MNQFIHKNVGMFTFDLLRLQILPRRVQKEILFKINLADKSLLIATIKIVAGHKSLRTFDNFP